MIRVHHQFSLFDFNTMKPKKKIPISRERILEAKALFDKGDIMGSVSKMRELREALERYERTL